jgi:hypothetical protein
VNKVNLGNTISILANIGVIAGIFFLAFELNQDRQLTRSQMRHELSQGSIDVVLMFNEDLETSNLVLRGLAGEALTDDEEARFGALLVAWYRHMENMHYQYRNGLYDDNEFRGNASFWRQRLAVPVVREHWCETNPVFSEDFVDAVNLLADIKCD